MYIYVALAAYNTGYLTLPMGSIETIIDEAANVATLDGTGSMGSSYEKVGSGHKRHGSGTGKDGKRREKEEKRQERKRSKQGKKRDWRALWSVGTDACLDVPLGGVCEVLYGEGRDADPEEDTGARRAGMASG